MPIPRDLSGWHPRHACALNVMINLWSYARDDGTDRIVERSNQQLLEDCKIANEGILRRALRECESAGYIERIGSGPRRKFKLIAPAGLAQEVSRDRVALDPVSGDPVSGDRGGGLERPLATLETLVLSTGVDQVEQSTSSVDSPQPAPESPPKPSVAEIWKRQDELRVQAYAKHGKTGRQKPRPLRLTAAARVSVARALSDYGEPEVRRALQVCAENAAESLKSLSYFDGVSNWRPANIARFVAAEPGMLEARSNGEPQDLTKGPLFADCANKEYAEQEKCVRPDAEMLRRGAELAREFMDD